MREHVASTTTAEERDWKGIKWICPMPDSILIIISIISSSEQSFTYSLFSRFTIQQASTVVEQKICISSLPPLLYSSSVASPMPCRTQAKLPLATGAPPPLPGAPKRRKPPPPLLGAPHPLAPPQPAIATPPATRLTPLSPWPQSPPPATAPYVYNSLPCPLPIPNPSLSPLHPNLSPPPHRQPPPQSKLSPKPTSSPPPPTKPSTPPFQASPSLRPPTQPKLSRQKSLAERPRCPEKMLSTLWRKLLSASLPRRRILRRRLRRLVRLLLRRGWRSRRRFMGVWRLRIRWLIRLVWLGQGDIGVECGRSEDGREGGSIGWNHEFFFGGMRGLIHHTHTLFRGGDGWIDEKRTCSLD